MALTTKQQAFVDAYLANGFNGTKAAKAAGYTGNDNVLGVTAYDNLRNPKIKELIDERMKAFTMSAAEVLYRLSEEARGDLGEFIGLETQDLIQHPKSFLLKKYKRTVTRRGKADDPIVTETVEVELYDAQAAKVQLGRYHKLFTDTVEQTGTIDVNISDAKSKLTHLLARQSPESGAGADTESTE